MLQLHSLLMVIPAALTCLWNMGYRGIQNHGICTMQQDVTVTFMVRTVMKRLNKDKGWYKKVTLTTIPICRTTEDVLHCNPVLGFQMSKGGCKYGFDWWFLWLTGKLLWLWDGITFILYTSMLPTGFYFFLLFIFSIRKIMLYCRSSPIYFKFHYWAARGTRTLLPCCPQLVKNKRWHGVVCFAAFFWQL